jgi:hypothetical protein
MLSRGQESSSRHFSLRVRFFSSQHLSCCVNSCRTSYDPPSFNSCWRGAVIPSLPGDGCEIPAVATAFSEVFELCFSVQVTDIGSPQQKSPAVADSRCSIRPQETQW